MAHMLPEDLLLLLILLMLFGTHATTCGVASGAVRRVARARDAGFYMRCYI
jgi:hypothetical protein